MKSQTENNNQNELLETMEQSKEQSNNLPIVNLPALANKIANSPKFQGINEDKPEFVPFAIGLKKYPHLEPIKDLTAFKIFKLGKEDVRAHVPCVYRKDNQLILILPDFNQSLIEEFQIESVNLGYRHSKVLVKDIPLIVSIALSDDGVIWTRDESNVEALYEHIEVENIQVSWFKELVINGCSPKELKQGEYRMKWNGIKSDKFKKPLVDLYDVKGETVIYQNILPNSDMANILITSTFPKIKIGNTIKLKKGGSKTTVVEID